MNLDQIATKCFILALFIRDDGERLLLGDGFYDFKSNLQHFQANTIANDIVEIQGDNGQLLAGQVMRSGTQKFEGYIGDATTSRQTIEQKRSDFMAFFRIKHFYKVVYIFPDGTAIQRQRGYLTDAPAVPEIFQKFPEYHIALNFEDVNYYEYAEDEYGDEIYAHIAELALAGGATGGLVWDEIGAVTNGITWSGIQTAQGEYISITNELDIPAKLASVEMLGKAEQDGTPTPDSPIPVQVVTGENVVKIEGKNLFDGNYVAYAIGGSNGNQWFVANSSRSAIISCAPSTTYTVKKNGGNRFSIADAPTIPANNAVVNVIYNNASASQYTFTTSATARYLLVYVSNDSTEPEMQAELGSTATTYEPYQGQEFPIDLGSIELAKIGDYQDYIWDDGGTWEIHKEIGKVDLGTLTWVSEEQFASGQFRATMMNLPEQPLLNGDLLCPIFIWQQGGVTYLSLQDGHMSVTNSQATPLLRVRNSASYSSMSASNFTTAMNGIVLYYALATPTTTEITNEALIAQLDALGASSLYLGVNNIGTETQNAMPTLKIEYYTEVELEGAGYEWEPGGNTAKTIVTVAGVDSAWPIWTVQGGARNPTLTNITTGQTISWQGFVPEGQTLTINMAEMTADLAGANVFEYITGEWIRLAPGNNTLVYTAGSADKPSTLSWNGVLA